MGRRRYALISAAIVDAKPRGVTPRRNITVEPRTDWVPFITRKTQTWEVAPGSNQTPSV